MEMNSVISETEDADAAFHFLPKENKCLCKSFFMWLLRNDPSEAKKLNIKQPPPGDAAETRGQW